MTVIYFCLSLSCCSRLYVIGQYHTLHPCDFSELEEESFMLPVEDDIPASQEVSVN